MIVFFVVIILFVFAVSVPINREQFEVYFNLFDRKYEDNNYRSPVRPDCPDKFGPVFCDSSGNIHKLTLVGGFNSFLNRFNADIGFGLPYLTTVEFSGPVNGNLTNCVF